MKSAPSDNNSFVPAHSNCIHALYFPCQCFCARTPTKGVTLPSWAYSVTSVFQSTLPRREWRHWNTAASSYCHFNPHSHEGSDLNDMYCLPHEGDFNPHSHEGSDHLRSSMQILMMYFNPHSHEGSDCICFKIVICAHISIHTPTKGVTNSCEYIAATAVISIHTPTKGVTLSTIIL